MTALSKNCPGCGTPVPGTRGAWCARCAEIARVGQSVGVDMTPLVGTAKMAKARRRGKKGRRGH